MKKLIHFAFGYMVILMLKKCVILQKKSQCIVKSEASGYVAECKDQVFGNVPSDLNKAIIKLDLSGSTFEKLDESSFKPYANLQTLICKNMRIRNDISDKYVLKPLEKLQEVFIERVKLTDSSTFYWPKNIRTINITQCFAKKLDLTNVHQLKVLDANTNDLEDIPMINELAPIDYVNLKSNPLSEASVQSLARVCRVTHLDLHLTSNSDLKTQKSYCRCKEMIDWMKKYQIKSNIFTEENSFRCSSYAQETKCADSSDNAEALRLRQNCLDKSKPTSSLIIFMILVIFTIVVLLLLVLFAYMYGSLRKKADMGEVVEIHRGKGDASPAEETTPEEDEPSPLSDGPQKN